MITTHKNMTHQGRRTPFELRKSIENGEKNKKNKTKVEVIAMFTLFFSKF